MFSIEPLGIFFPERFFLIVASFMIPFIVASIEDTKLLTYTVNVTLEEE